ncbi:MAG: transcription antitermination factor NusB [Piscirickettsiaceae bacterium CG_4_9_14_3_um_filter_43_564]|nr:transcription antitermination factor NusB [Thiomicrospira sp.]PIQ03178.1 MAG: transcription antitermination factor NusB [Piscirickettsiaceae bacterium CG18_big_fil_WC_8_21_14_2_50_44_103]PIU39453.1 MAG: transcription antitermination factor NusB [Piscirickettsiaceae bacterium CG07_land_8_20_14_0_80_44_28]PIW58540.1 MAG: transcription antitermination factor NusB [Piscirickettsiaceae bacterium CG12_big_fil_rev_8_21_14_0_65_44_934]PIW78399.1 MAG: transcription antitermination factor NusB [Piscir
MKLSDIKPGEGEEVVEEEVSVSLRTQTRRVALQALYQWQVNRSDVLDIIKQFSEAGRLDAIDVALFQDIVNGVVRQSDTLDALYQPYLDRAVAMIDPVEKNILRMGVQELQDKIEIPYRVVINEAVELAKRFGAEESHKYINGILDKVALDLRTLERGQPKA